MSNLFFSDGSAVGVQIVSQVNRMNSCAGPLVQGRLFADPEVDLPVERARGVHEGVEDDVAVAFVELAVKLVLDLKNKILAVKMV